MRSSRRRLTAVCAAALIAASAVAGIGWLTRAPASAAPAPVTPTRAPATPTRVAHPHASAAATNAAANATTALGLNLLRILPASGNLVFSPDSIAVALAMAGTGAAGQNANQIAHALSLASPTAFPSLGTLQSTLQSEQAAAGQGNPHAPVLDVADALFLEKGFKPLAPFTSTLTTDFGAAPQVVDFAKANAAAVAALNAFVSDHTQGIIPRILSSISPSTLLALVNALYLKATWQDQFSPSQTTTAVFHAARGSEHVPFMNETGGLPYGRGSGYTAVSLPYVGSTLSLLVVLPVGQTVTALQRRLTVTSLNAIVAHTKSTQLSLSLPRFHLSFAATLNGPLQSLGMTDAFSSRPGNFTRIVAQPQLQVGLVQHAADFTVDEHGTVAAAATVVGIQPTAIALPSAHFTADRPFLFFLRDNRSGALLFAGRLADAASAPAPAPPSS